MMLVDPRKNDLVPQSFALRAKHKFFFLPCNRAVSTRYDVYKNVERKKIEKETERWLM